MKMGKFKPSYSLALSVGFLVWAGAAYAQSAPQVPSRQVFYSNIEPLTATIERTRRDPRPKTAKGAVQLLDWLIYGNVGLGGAYDSNLYGSPNATSAYGVRFAPSVVASRNTGIQRTLLYGKGDLRYYPAVGHTDLQSATAGVQHVWEIQRDLIFRAQVEGTSALQYSSLVPSGTVKYIKPARYQSLFGSTSIQKNFGDFFAAIGGSITGNTFQDTEDNLGHSINEHFQDGTRATLNARLGYNISPIVYTFIEPSLNWGRFRESNLNSSGYKIVGGLGSGRISLFNGEIYAGVLKEKFEDPATPDLTEAIYGGRLSWYPTRFITVTLSGEQSLGTSDFSPTVYTTGSVTKLDKGRLEANWSMTRDLTLGGAVEFRRYNYLDSDRRDDLLEISSSINYMLTEQLGIGLYYTYDELSSNTPGVAYSRSFVSLGATSKF